MTDASEVDRLRAEVSALRRKLRRPARAACKRCEGTGRQPGLHNMCGRCGGSGHE